MKSLFRNLLARGGALCALVLAALLASPAAFAAGTAAGTSVSNVASLTYSVGGIPQNYICSSPSGNTAATASTCTSTTFVVDNKVNWSVVTTDTSPGVQVIPGMTDRTLTFTVTNLGNNTQNFELTGAQLSSGSQTIFGGSVTDNFDSTSCSIQAATGGSTTITNLLPDQGTTVYVVCSIPLAQVNGDLSGYRLTADARVAGTNAAITYSTSANANNSAAVENVKSVVNEAAVMGASSLTARSNDLILGSKVKATFVDTADMQAQSIKVVVERGVVYLMGRVTEREATRAADIARTVGGVQKVVRVFEVISEAELQALQPKK